MLTAALACAQDLDDRIPRQFTSPNGNYTLKVDVSSQDITLSRGWHKIWEVPYPQGAPPRTAYVTDNGKRVCLIDVSPPGFVIDDFNHGNGIRLAVLDEDGRLIKGYRIKDFRTGAHLDLGSLSEDTQAMFPAPDESTHLNAAQDQVQFLLEAYEQINRDTAASKGHLVSAAIDLQDGSQPLLSQVQANAIAAPFAAQCRLNLKSTDLSKLTEACEYLGYLRDKESEPVLRLLLDSPVLTGTGESTPGKSYDIHGVQTEAGQSLALICGREAVPALIAHLKIARGPYDRDQWIYALQLAGAAPDEETIRQMAGSTEASDRLSILQDLEGTDNQAAVREARSLLADSDDRVRSQALGILSRHGTTQDVAFLTSKLRVEPAYAVKGLLRIHPPDLPAKLGKVALGQKDSAADWSVLGLAQLGDPKALQQLQAIILGYTKNPGSFAVDPDETGLFWEATKVLADRHPPGAAATLKKALVLKDCMSWSDVQARVALVKLGERQYTDDIRHIATGSDPFEADFAIRGLGEIGDRQSIPLLERIANESDTLLKPAAEEALEDMGVQLPAPVEPTNLDSTAQPTRASDNQTPSTPPANWFYWTAELVAAGFLAWLWWPPKNRSI